MRTARCVLELMIRVIEHPVVFLVVFWAALATAIIFACTR